MEVQPGELVALKESEELGVQVPKVTEYLDGLYVIENMRDEMEPHVYAELEFEVGYHSLGVRLVRGRRRIIRDILNPYRRGINSWLAGCRNQVSRRKQKPQKISGAHRGAGTHHVSSLLWLG